MSYYFTKTIKASFAEAEARAREALKAEGFGVLTEIDVTATLKARLGAEFRPYRILGACHPQSAHRALLAEDKIGLMLPCNLVLQEKKPGEIEIAAVDPVASMLAVENPELGGIAEEVRARLRSAIARV